MIIAVDFDGTIVSNRFPEIGEPIQFAFDSLIMLAEEGNRIILWTYREGKELDEAVEFCRENGLEFYAVNSEYPNGGWADSSPTRKIHADVYIDDRNFGGLPDWSYVYAKLGAGGALRVSGHKKKGFFSRLKAKCKKARLRMRYER